MRVVIDRNYEAGNWTAQIEGGEAFHVDGEDARAAVVAVQKLHPGADVGVKSRVFGRATMAAYGSVVWMKPNLN